MLPSDAVLFDGYLVIDQPWQRFGHWSSALVTLDDHRAPAVAAAAGYYDPMADQALVAVRYEPQDRARGLALVIELALLEEIGLIQPAELTDGDRDRFRVERLAKCTVRVGYRLGVGETLAELVRRIRDHRSTRPVAVAVAPVPPPPVPRPSVPRLPTPQPRGDTADPVLLVAKGTRDDLRHRAAMTESSSASRPAFNVRSTRDELRTPARPSAPATRPTAHILPRRRRIDTVEVSPVEAYRKATASMMPPMRATSPTEASLEGPLPPGIIYARYLRSGRWIPIRIGALSLRGAALLTGALPRLEDQVEVSFAFGGHRAIVRGSVGKVSSQRDVQVSGTSTFSVKFDLDSASREQLTSLLTAARAANVTIKPPPSRTTRRFLVDLPMRLHTSRGVVRGDAFDVSREGMFVKPVHPLSIGSVIGFSCALDLGASISGRARVVRHLPEVDARVCGVASGYGLNIVEMTASDHEQWGTFLARIEQRVSRLILVGASPERLVEIQQALTAVGYATCGESEASALVDLSEQRPVDAALIDGGWPSPATSSEWVEAIFASRKVPCVAVFGDARMARATVDRLLSIA